MRTGSIVVGVVACLTTGQADAQTEFDPRGEASQVWQSPDERPTQPPKLDTAQIAAAHRVRARSMEERTSGLWQSWLVSICEGCGPDRKPFFRRTGFRLAQTPPPSPSRARKVLRTARYETPAPDDGPSAFSDLSNARIDRIRRQPVP